MSGGESTPPGAPGETFPFVTVVLPVRNEARHLSACLETVLAQDYPAERMEILVADGRSKDGTRDVVAAHAARDPRVRLVDNPGLIVPTGLNAAISASRGSAIVRVDGHTLLDRDYVSEAVKALARTGADVVGGNMAATGTSLFGRAVAAATSTPMGVGGSTFHYSRLEAPADTVYMGTFRHDVFTRYGPFDERCVRNQDDEFNYRVRELGGRVFLAPAMKSLYFPRESPRALFRQYFQYGFFKILVATLHPRMMRPRHFIPSAFVLILAALAIGACFSAWTGIALAALLCLHAGASLGFAAGLARRDPAAWPLVPVATFILHVAYGAGLICGAFAFLARRYPAGGSGAPGRAT